MYHLKSFFLGNIYAFNKTAPPRGEKVGRYTFLYGGTNPSFNLSFYLRGRSSPHSLVWHEGLLVVPSEERCTVDHSSEGNKLVVRMLYVTPLP